MKNFYTFIILIIFWILVKLLKKKPNKHTYNIKKGNEILERINSFNYPGQKLNYLRKIDPFVFEELVLSAFEKRNFKIKRNKKYTGDGGVDGIVFNENNEKILLQMKRYKSFVSLAHLKEFEVLIKRKKAKKGYFVHTGKTGKKTYQEFKNTSVEIISGEKLIDLLNQKY